MIDEMNILSMEQQGLQPSAQTDSVPGPHGFVGNSRFSVQTGEDFEDFDLIGIIFFKWL